MWMAGGCWRKKTCRYFCRARIYIFGVRTASCAQFLFCIESVSRQSHAMGQASRRAPGFFSFSLRFYYYARTKNVPINVSRSIPPHQRYIHTWNPINFHCATNVGWLSLLVCPMRRTTKNSNNNNKKICIFIAAPKNNGAKHVCNIKTERNVGRAKEHAVFFYSYRMANECWMPQRQHYRLHGNRNDLVWDVIHIAMEQIFNQRNIKWWSLRGHVYRILYWQRCGKISPMWQWMQCSVHSNFIPHFFLVWRKCISTPRIFKVEMTMMR